MKNLTHYSTKILFSILGGGLMYFSWFPNEFWPLIFISFLPFFFIEDSLYQSDKSKVNISFYLYSLLYTLTWNLLTTWWIGFASIGGASLAIILNSLMLAFVIFTYHICRVYANQLIALLFLTFLWLSFEQLHLNWDMSWPWLNLGNVFCNATYFIQWYEFTGVAGGSLLIIITNILIYMSLKDRKIRGRLLSAVLMLFFLLSVLSYYLSSEQRHVVSKTSEVIVSQPNVDPYNEKFSGEGNMQQIQKFLIPIKEKLTSKTDLIIGPETAIPMNLWETNLDSTYEIKYLKGISKENRNIPILLGASTCKLYSTNETVTSRKVMNSHFYYDSYNTALWINNEYQTALYHKSKLVPGVEIIPFPGVMKYFEKFAIDLGGTIGSLGIQESRDVFRSAHSPICAAPIICYESIYGEFVGKYVQNGANLLCIITNDGWWDNTAGYKQHLNYARLRAIENRRWIARSANTGISAFIDEQGNIVSQSNWWVSTALRMDVKLQTKKTFYTMHGDFIYRIATYLLIATFLLILLIHVKKRSI